MINKILILGWPHPSNTLFSLAKSLEKELIENGVNVTIVNFTNQEEINGLNKYARNHFNSIFFMGSPPLLLKIHNEYLFDYYQGYCYFWVLDPIIYDLTSSYAVSAVWDFLNSSQNTSRLFFLFPDRSYMEFMENILGNRAIYFPFAVSSNNIASLDCSPNIESIDRSDILVMANFGQECCDSGSVDLMTIINTIDPFNLSQQKKSDLVSFIMHDEENSNISIAIKKYIGFSDLDLLNYQILPLLVAIDSSEKRRRRFNILNSVSAQIDIIGSGWFEVLGSKSNIKYLQDNVQHNRISNFFSKYKVLLDFSPNWDAGFNDRVMTALANGCRVVTTKNSAVNELGKASRLVSTYSAHFPNPDIELEFFLNNSPIEGELISLIKNQNWMSRINKLPSIVN